MARLPNFFSSVKTLEGFALYCDDSGFLDIQEYKGNEKKYYCGNKYYVYQYVNPEEQYVLCVIDANECSIGVVNENIETLWHKESFVSRKVDAGGQSASRYQMNRENELVQWLKDCSDALRSLVNGRKLIIGGPGPVKTRFLEYFKYNRIIAVKDVGNTDYNGLEELFDRSLDDIKECKRSEIKVMVDDFAKRLAKGDKLIDYGFSNIDMNNVEKVIVDREFESQVPEGIPKVVTEGHHIIKALQVGIIRRYGGNGNKNN